MRSIDEKRSAPGKGNRFMIRGEVEFGTFWKAFLPEDNRCKTICGNYVPPGLEFISQLVCLQSFFLYWPMHAVFFLQCALFLYSKKKKEGRENSWVIIENHYKIADQMIFFYNSRRPVPTCFLRDCKWVWLSDLIFLGNWLIEINQLFHTQSQLKKNVQISFMPTNEVCVFWFK